MVHLEIVGEARGTIPRQRPDGAPEKQSERLFQRLLLGGRRAIAPLERASGDHRPPRVAVDTIRHHGLPHPRRHPPAGQFTGLHPHPHVEPAAHEPHRQRVVFGQRDHRWNSRRREVGPFVAGQLALHLPEAAHGGLVEADATEPCEGVVQRRLMHPGRHGDRAGWIRWQRWTRCDRPELRRPRIPGAAVRPRRIVVQPHLRRVIDRLQPIPHPPLQHPIDPVGQVE